MQRIILGILGIVAAFYLLKYRERIGDMIGEANWMQPVGGVYNVLIISSLFIFFWSVAYLTNTESFFLSPVKFLIPGAMQRQAPVEGMLN